MEDSRVWLRPRSMCEKISVSEAKSRTSSPALPIESAMLWRPCATLKPAAETPKTLAIMPNTSAMFKKNNLKRGKCKE